MRVAEANDYTEAVIPRSANSLEVTIDWYKFLARPRLSSPAEEPLKALCGASILVTGAGGSIGRALSLRLAALQPRRLVLLDASEQAIFLLQIELKAAGILALPEFVLGSISNALELEDTFAMYRPSLVFHAAAHKHVALLEQHPFAAIENNALGTYALLEAAQRHAVSRVVLLSTDKAVDPMSMLGATKNIAEQITLKHDGVVVRLANVLGTDGSAVETFINQIERGEAIIIRNRASERYFLTSEEAVDLLLAAAVEAAPRSVLVPRLERAYHIVDLADFLISTFEHIEQDRGMPARMIFAELCDGEKVCETLLSADEADAIDAENDGKASYKSLSPETTYALLAPLMAKLKVEVKERDLAAALDTIRSLVPSYTSSATVQRIAIERGLRGVPS